MDLTTLILDFGNVVGFFSHGRAVEALAPHARVSPEQLHQVLHTGPLAEAYEVGEVSSEEFLRAAQHECGIACSLEAMAEKYANIFWFNKEVITQLPEAARRFRLFLLSNTNELHARRFLQQFAEPLRHFDHLILSHEVGARKPHAAIYEHALRRANCPPEQILFIDDIPANVQGAQQLGWRGIVYKPGTLLQQLREFGIGF